MPPRIHWKKCQRCGVCVFQCGMHVFSLEKNTLMQIKKDDCVHCFICEIYCPQKAISIYLERKDVFHEKERI